MVAVKLPDIMSGSIPCENILSIRVLEWLVILFGCKIKGINELEARESKNLSGYAHYNLILKSPSSKIDFCSLEIFSNSLFK